jgi:hypothetical protein
MILSAVTGRDALLQSLAIGVVLGLIWGVPKGIAHINRNGGFLYLLKAFFKTILSSPVLLGVSAFCLLVSMELFRDSVFSDRSQAFVVMAAGVGVVALLLKKGAVTFKRKFLCLVYGGVALAFNPFFPAEFIGSAYDYQGPFFLASLLFFAAIFFCKESNKHSV